MRAVILAAGQGKRLAGPGRSAAARPDPKCLLRFDGRTLLERHLRLLRRAGVESVTLVLGYAHQRIVSELDAIAWSPRPEIVLNPRHDLGSVFSVHCARAALTLGGDVLLMDADVLYDQRILQPLCAGRTADRIPFDTGFEPGEEPVKLCMESGRIVDFRKRVGLHLRCDTIGETVGFFRLSGATAARLADRVAAYVDADRTDQPHEEALRDLFLERPAAFECIDIAGAPWLEIDFPADLERARRQIYPRLLALPT